MPEYYLVISVKHPNKKFEWLDDFKWNQEIRTNRVQRATPHRNCYRKNSIGSFAPTFNIFPILIFIVNTFIYVRIIKYYWLVLYKVTSACHASRSSVNVLFRLIKFCVVEPICEVKDSTIPPMKHTLSDGLHMCNRHYTCELYTFTFMVPWV